jgi:hypothetical protein
MTLKEARRLETGSLVRQSWAPSSISWGIVLDKKHVKGRHRAKSLCQDKNERYDITVQWINGPRVVTSHLNYESENPEIMQNWELMVISRSR